MCDEIIVKCPNCHDMNYFDDVCGNCPDGTDCDNCDEYSCNDCGRRLNT